MNELTDSPYKTPEANLTQPINDKSVLNLRRFSAWGVFGLTIITIGIYPYYWMYSRAKILNSLHEDKISSALLISFLVVVVLSYVSGPIDENDAWVLIITNLVITLLFLVLYLIVLFKIRNRLQNIMNRSGNKQYKLSGVLAFFFNAIYLQYKINECIDELQPTPFDAPSIGKDFAKSIAEPLSEESESREMRMIVPIGRSGWAIASGYLALFSILFVPAPFALLTGILGIRDIRRNPKKHGMGRALFGIIMGVIFTAWLCLLLLGLVPFPLG